MMKQRYGPVLDVLLGTFVYTTKKVAEYRNCALLFKTKTVPSYTSFADTIFRSNKMFARECKVDIRVGTKWKVNEKNFCL